MHANTSITTSPPSLPPSSLFNGLYVALENHILQWLDVNSLLVFSTVGRSHQLWLKLNLHDAWEAVRRGCTRDLKLQLHRHPQIVNEMREGNTLLGLAIKCGCVSMVRLLLRRGANANLNSRVLLENGVPREMHPMLCAAVVIQDSNQRRNEILHSLVHFGANYVDSFSSEASEIASIGLLIETHYNVAQSKMAMIKLASNIEADPADPALLPTTRQPFCSGYKDSSEHPFYVNSKRLTTHLIKWLDTNSLSAFTSSCKRHYAWFKAYSVWEAVEQGYKNMVKLKILRDPKLLSAFRNAHWYDKTSLVGHAVDYNQPKIVRLLLKSGASANGQVCSSYTRIPAFVTAASRDHGQEIMRSLLHFKADIETCDSHGRTALMEAADDNKLSIIQFLLANNANVHAQDDKGRTPLMLAAKKGHVGVIHALLQFDRTTLNAQCLKGKKTALMRAAKKGHVDAVKTLLAYRPHLELRGTQGNTALMHAVLQRQDLSARVLKHETRQEAALKLLLTHHPKANINISNDLGHLIYQYLSSNARHATIPERFLDEPCSQRLVKLLISSGAPINQSPSPYVDLSWFLAFAPQLIQLGAEPNARDSGGRTLLMSAVIEGKQEIVTFLLKQPSIDLHATDHQGKTALKYATYAKYEQESESQKRCRDKILESLTFALSTQTAIPALAPPTPAPVLAPATVTSMLATDSPPAASGNQRHKTKKPKRLLPPKAKDKGVPPIEDKPAPSIAPAPKPLSKPSTPPGIFAKIWNGSVFLVSRSVLLLGSIAVLRRASPRLQILAGLTASVYLGVRLSRGKR